VIILGITDTLGSEQKFRKYTGWLESGFTDVEFRVLSYKADNMGEFRQCQGLVLTGGHDVHPSLYGAQDLNAKIRTVDLRRDHFERNLLDQAIVRAIPVLAICRGLQLVNVHLGGSLIPDLPDAGYHGHSTENGECRHKILVSADSALSHLLGAAEGEVISSHHQAVDRIADGLAVAARAHDGIIEALEWPNAPAFFQMVQYHPERMEDRSNPFAGVLLRRFLESIKTTTEQLST
jgi:putative glutamine amidotransferase